MSGYWKVTALRIAVVHCCHSRNSRGIVNRSGSDVPAAIRRVQSLIVFDL